MKFQDPEDDEEPDDEPDNIWPEWNTEQYRK